MKKCIATMMLALSVMTLAGQTVDTYNFKMNLKIPRIYNNMQSLGYRKYQPQTLKGELQLVYKDTGETLVRVKNLENRTHKINGMNITYICYDYPYEGHTPLVVAIGNNKTGKFTQGAVEFAFQADPSYNIGGVDEDNTLILELSGYGNIRSGKFKTIRGSVKGQIGCGCRAYGHVSPTRLWLGFLSNIVWDIAPVNGTFTATFKDRKYEKDEKQD